MNRTTLRAGIQALGYGTDVQSVAAQDKALDQVLLELAGEREWSWLRTRATGSLTVGDDDVPVPADLAVPTAVRLSYQAVNAYAVTLVELDAEQIKQFLNEDTGTDLPEFWSWSDRTVKVYPLPNLAYSYVLEYVRIPDTTTFDQDTESPPFDLRFHAVLIWGAARILAYRQRDQVGKSQADAEYQAAKLNFSQADRRGEPDHVSHWQGWSDY